MAMDVQAVKDRALRTLKGFTPSQLAILSVLGVVAIIASVAFLRWVNTPTYSVLLAGLDAKDAASVTGQLTSDGVTYQLTGGGSTVLVPADQLDAERLKVAAAGLPASSTDSGWAVFDKQGLTSSSFQQQVAYQRALESTLGSTLTGIKGVQAASVHLALPEKSVFTEEQQPARASVLLTTRGALDGGAVDSVTRLVSSAVPNLAPEDVSVTDDKGTLLTGSGSGASSDQAQAALEDSLSARATTMLDTLLGPGHAVVRVSAQLQTASTSTDSETYDNSKVAVTHESSSTETYDSSGSAGGSGGVVAQPTAQPSAGTSASPGAYDKSDVSKDYGVSRTVTSTKDGPGGIKRLTVAVAVDNRVKNGPTQADLQSLVGNAVGLDPARGDTIAVTTPAFQTTAAPAAAASSGTKSLAALVPTVLGGLLLLLVGLGFFRTLRSGKNALGQQVQDEQTAAAITAEAGEPSALRAAGTRALPVADDTDSLVELVDEHPDEVAHLLRGWVASTAGSSR